MNTSHLRTAFLFLSMGFMAAFSHGQTAGSVDASFNPNVAYSSGDPYVQAMALQPDGKIIIGGTFSHVGGIARPFVARLNADGTVDASFDAALAVDAAVICLAVQEDGKILIGGIFTSVNGQTRNRIARLHANGTLESTTTFNPGTGPNAAVYCMRVQRDGKILIGGEFTQINGVTNRNCIARLNADGTLESTSTFNISVGANGTVYTLALQNDGKILIGGEFTRVRNIERVRIARLNSNGTLESTATFNVGTGAGGGSQAVYGIAVQADGKILLGGGFTTVNGQPRPRLARLNADGSVEGTGTFNIGTGPNNLVYHMLVQANQQILLAGSFTQFGGQARNKIARLNPDGSLEDTATFNHGSGVDMSLNAIAQQADGKILLGGSFLSVSGVARNSLARLNNDAVSQVLSAATVQRAQWLRGGAAPEVEQVSFDLSTDGGSSWSPLGAGTRISGGWECIGLNLPMNGHLRARGRTGGAYQNGSNGIVEQFQAFSGLQLEPEIVVEQPVLTNLADGGARSFGQTLVGSDTSLSFVIRNSGLADLTGLNVTIDGPDAADFVVTEQPTAPVPSPSGTTTFSVKFTPSGTGAKTAALHFANNDTDESPFDINLSGSGIIALTADYSTGLEIPLSANGFTATGSTASFSLNHAPLPGTQLMVVNNTGRTFLQGTFVGLPQGQPVSLTYGGQTYDFVANYFGGDGNDLVLAWANTRWVSWGYNAEGELGNGTASPFSTTPLNAAGALSGRTVLSAASGAFHTVALCSDGTLVTFGGNESGQLGSALPGPFLTPATMTVSGALVGKTVTSIAAGRRHNLALCMDGTVTAWGANENGQLGNNSLSTTAGPTPVAVSTTGALAGKSVVAIAAGGSHSLAICSDGTVVAWGQNQSGQLGNGGGTDSAVPVLVTSTGALAGRSVIAIAAGESHSLALCSDGTVVAWGANAHGQLGFEGADSPMPVLVSSGVLSARSVVSLSAGLAHSLALCSDGTLAAWGANSTWELGDGTYIGRAIPVAVSTAGALASRSVTQLLSGESHSIALASDGNVIVWGRNDLGQLGNGTTTNSPQSTLTDSSGLAPGERFIRVISGPGAATTMALVASPPASEIMVEQPALAEISDGGSRSFGSVLVGSSSSLTFIVKNTGKGNLTGIAITQDGDHAADFVITTQPAPLVAPAGSTTVVIDFIPSGPGLRTASIHLTSNDRDESPFDIQLSGTGAATLVTIDASGDVGQYTSQAIVNGHPAIAYYDATQGDLKYVRATNPGGTAWGTPVTVSAVGDVGSCASLAVINGRPAISFIDKTTVFPTLLKFVRAADADGSSWNAPVIIDFHAGEWNPDAQNTSLRVVGGRPAVAYHEGSSVVEVDNYGLNLRYIRALDANGSTWGDSVNITPAGPQDGYLSSMQVVNGRPMIAFYNATSGSLEAFHSADPTGSMFGPRLSIAQGSGQNVGGFASLWVVQGRPAVSYYDWLSQSLLFVRAANPEGTAWSPPVSIATTGNAGQYTSLQMIGGMPAISFFSATLGDLQYVSTTTADGSAWSAPTTLDSSGVVGQYSSLQDLNGSPGISYYDATNKNLKYAVVPLATGPQISMEQPPGTPLPNGVSSIDFGKIAPGDSSAFTTLTVRSTGSGAVPEISIMKLGIDPADFTLVTTDLISELPSGETTTFTVAFTPSSAGAKTATLRLAKHGADPTPFFITLTGTATGALEDWRFTHFNTTADAGDAADLNDFDSDGAANLLEFATHRQPDRGEGSFGEVTRSGSRLHFRYTRSKAALLEGIRFFVEWSDSLTPPIWSPLGVTSFVVSEDSQSQWIESIIPAGSQSSRFIRLRVER